MELFMFHMDKLISYKNDKSKNFRTTTTFKSFKKHWLSAIFSIPIIFMFLLHNLLHRTILITWNKDLWLYLWLTLMVVETKKTASCCLEKPLIYDTWLQFLSCKDWSDSLPFWGPIFFELIESNLKHQCWSSKNE